MQTIITCLSLGAAGPTPPQPLLTSSEPIETLHGNIESRDNSINIDRITMENTKTLLATVAKSVSSLNLSVCLGCDFHFSPSIYRLEKKKTIKTYKQHMTNADGWMLKALHPLMLFRKEDLVFLTVTEHIHDPYKKNEVWAWHLPRAHSSSCFPLSFQLRTPSKQPVISGEEHE